MTCLPRSIAGRGAIAGRAPCSCPLPCRRDPNWSDILAVLRAGAGSSRGEQPAGSAWRGSASLLPASLRKGAGNDQRQSGRSRPGRQQSTRQLLRSRQLPAPGAYGPEMSDTRNGATAEPASSLLFTPSGRTVARANSGASVGSATRAISTLISGAGPTVDQSAICVCAELTAMAGLLEALEIGSNGAHQSHSVRLRQVFDHDLQLA